MRICVCECGVVWWLDGDVFVFLYDCFECIDELGDGYVYGVMCGDWCVFGCFVLFENARYVDRRRMTGRFDWWMIVMFVFGVGWIVLEYIVMKVVSDDLKCMNEE